MKQISLFVILFLGLESFGFHISPARTALRIKALSHKTNHPFRYNQPRYIGQHFAEINEGEEEEKLLENEEDVNEASKRQMLGFAIPALGIFLCNPLLSNIDNAFVGRMSGTSGLAALSPATICTDQVLYLFSFLSRATTGMVSRAYASEKNTENARSAASAPLTLAIAIGSIISICYAIFTPNLLSMLQVNPSLRPAASSYIHWRGSITWAALAQSVSLSILLATRDAMTPLKIVLLAAVVNIFGDYFLCASPFYQLGCGGAGAATAFATLFSSSFMLKALHKKKLLPKLKLPTKDELKELSSYGGVLILITITRLIGFLSMQQAASALGVKQLAAYQLSINIMMFFLLFGEPLSQLSQTKLPFLLDSYSSSRSNGTKERQNIIQTLKSISILALFCAGFVGLLSWATLYFGSSIFTGDSIVQSLARSNALDIFAAVSMSILGVAADGTMLASRDFKFILSVGLSTCLIQLNVLKNHCTTVNAIFRTFTFRLASYWIAVFLRTNLGFGPLGRVLRGKKVEEEDEA